MKIGMDIERVVRGPHSFQQIVFAHPGPKVGSFELTDSQLQNLALLPDTAYSYNNRPRMAFDLESMTDEQAQYRIMKETAPEGYNSYLAITGIAAESDATPGFPMSRPQYTVEFFNYGILHNWKRTLKSEFSALQRHFWMTFDHTQMTELTGADPRRYLYAAKRNPLVLPVYRIRDMNVSEMRSRYQNW